MVPWLWPEQEGDWAISGGGQWEKSRFGRGEALRAGSAEQRLPVGVCVLESEVTVRLEGCHQRGQRRRCPGCAPLPDLTARVWRAGGALGSPRSARDSCAVWTLAGPRA